MSWQDEMASVHKIRMAKYFKAYEYINNYINELDTDHAAALAFVQSLQENGEELSAEFKEKIIVSTDHMIDLMSTLNFLGKVSIAKMELTNLHKIGKNRDTKNGEDN